MQECGSQGTVSISDKQANHAFIDKTTCIEGAIEECGFQATVSIPYKQANHTFIDRTTCTDGAYARIWLSGYSYNI